MRTLIDTARQTGGDDETRFAQLLRHGRGEFPTIGRGIARTDDGYHRPYQNIETPAHRDHGRRCIDGAQR